MKFAIAEKPIIRSGEYEELKCTIEDTAFILEILRSKIYSNPVRTVCQEIMSNARDAHREVGKDDMPINVKLPNTLDPRWICRDFGPGISPDRMANVFVKYGGSTKRSTNEQTGGFGIGAKTPWAYRDTFAIETYVPEEVFTDSDGEIHYNVMVKRSYIAFIDESRAGKVALIEEEVTDEPQGTAIIVTANTDDFSNFHAWTKAAGTYWDTRPEVSGDSSFEWPSYSIVTEGDDWFLVSKDEHKYDPDFICPKAIVDGIPYNLHQSALFGHGGSIELQDSQTGKILLVNLYAIFKYPLRICFNTGEVMLTASREEIDYASSDLELIKDKLKKALSAMRDQIADNIRNADTFWNAHIIHDQAKSIHGDLMKDVAWQGKFKLNSTTIHLSGYRLRAKKFWAETDNNAVKIRSQTYRHLPIRNDFVLVKQDDYGAPIRRNKIYTILLNNPGKSVIIVYSSVNNDEAGKAAAQNNFDKLNKNINFDQLNPILLSSIDPTPIPSGKKTASRNGGSAQGKKLQRSYRVYTKNGVENRDFDLKDDTEGFCYVVLYRNNLYVSKEFVNYYSDFAAHLESFKWLCKRHDIVLVPNKDIKYLNKNWTPAQDIIDKAVKEIIKKIGIGKIGNAHKGMREYRSIHVYEVMRDNRALFERVLDTENSIAWQYFDFTQRLAQHDNDRNILSDLMRHASNKTRQEINDSDSKGRNIDLDKLLNDYNNRYPLLVARGYAGMNVSPEHIAAYIKMCDES